MNPIYIRCITSESCRIKMQYGITSCKVRQEFEQRFHDGSQLLRSKKYMFLLANINREYMHLQAKFLFSFCNSNIQWSQTNRSGRRKWEFGNSYIFYKHIFTKTNDWLEFYFLPLLCCLFFYFRDDWWSFKCRRLIERITVASLGQNLSM